MSGVVPGAVRIEPRHYDDPVAASLRAELEAEMLARYGADTEPGAKPTASDVAVFLVAFDEGPLGCGGIRVLADGAAEIKRMYVRPAARGRGIARRLLVALEQAARELGCSVARLETGIEQPEAIALYERAGYRPIPYYGAYPASHLSRCFERTLGS